MEQLLLVNPSPRPSRRKKPRTAAQKRATAKLVAANKARRRRKTNPVTPVAAPKYRRSTRRARSAVTTYARRSRARKRNPIGGGIGDLLTGALTGAVGALAVNAAYNYLPIPATMRSGYTGYAVKGAFAVALGVFGKRLLGRRAVKAAEGSLVLTMSQAIIQASAGTGVNLGYYSPAVQYAPNPMYQRRLSEYVSGTGAAPIPSLADTYRGMGEYVS